jgi:phosphonate transport system substrate-binding protein
LILPRVGALLLSLVVVSSPTAAVADLTIGLIPEQNVFRQMKRYKPIADYIRQETGIGIRFTILSRYGNIIDSFSSENLDGAFWGSFTGALAIQKLDIEPIARPIWLDGTSTYHGYVFVRKDSGIKDVRDMKGKTIATRPSRPSSTARWTSAARRTRSSAWSRPGIRE